MAALTKFDRYALRLFGEYAKSSTQAVEHLSKILPQAHVFIRPEAYLAKTLMVTLLTFGGLLFGFLLVLALNVWGGLGLPGGAVLLIAFVPAIFAAGTFVSYFMAPSATALNRKRDIDAKIPYALNYISTVASAGMPPDRIFQSLAGQKVYGQVAKEAALISRDIHVLGRDLVTALVAASDRTPSTKMQSFLQGAVTALTSGEDLEHYFLMKAEQFTVENRHEQRRFLESLGVLAESYVTVVVGAPVFLIVLLSMTFVFGGGSPETALAMGYGLVLFLVPLSQIGFITVIKTITPEA